MSAEIQFYLVAVLVVIILGLSKGGFFRAWDAGNADLLAGRLAGASRTSG
jgi:hypothetical protein